MSRRPSSSAAPGKSPEALSSPDLPHPGAQTRAPVHPASTEWPPAQVHTCPQATPHPLPLSLSAWALEAAGAETVVLEKRHTWASQAAPASLRLEAEPTRHLFLMSQILGMGSCQLTVSFANPYISPPPLTSVSLCQSGHAASAAPQASSPPDYTMAWAEYYRQQVAFYGQTLGQAQAHSQVCSQSALLIPPRPAPTHFSQACVCPICNKSAGSGGAARAPALRRMAAVP